MRELAIGSSVTECQKAVDRMKGTGWKPITDIKLDDSMSAYGHIRYVCVMERPGDRERKTKWGQRFY